MSFTEPLHGTKAASFGAETAMGKGESNCHFTRHLAHPKSFGRATHIEKTPCLKLRDVGHTYGHFPGYDVEPASKVLRLLDKIRGR